MTTYIILDTERRYDEAAHARYQRNERFDPQTMSNDYPAGHALVTPRWILHELTAISWMTMSDEDGEGLAPLAMHSIGCPEHDEKAAVQALFEHIAGIGGDLTLVTWGGAKAELPMLVAAALTQGLRLPARLRALADLDRVREHPHIDLMHALCGRAPWVHMSEMAARLQIPAKLTCKADQVSRLMEQGKWSQVKAVCEGDVLTTAAILGHYLYMTDKAPPPFVTDLRLCRFVKRRLAHRDYAADFAAWQHQLEDAAIAAEMVKQETLCPQLT